MMCRNNFDKKDSKVLATQLSQPISSPLCCRVIQTPNPTPKIKHKFPQKAEKITIFSAKFDVHSPGELEPEVVKQK